MRVPDRVLAPWTGPSDTLSTAEPTSGTAPAVTPEEPPRFLSEPTYQALFAKIHQFGADRVRLDSDWRSDVRWGRNRITMAGDWRDVSVDVQQGGVRAGTNQTDPMALEALVAWAETLRRRFDAVTLPTVHPPPVKDTQVWPTTHIWSAATYAQTQDTRLGIAAQLIKSAVTSGLLSAGYMGVEAQGYVLELPDGRVEYAPLTYAQCSLTVRDPSGNASGWAGRSSYDWGRIDAEKLAAIALDKCLKSRNPVKIEPGRYTVILEPQATFELMKVVLNYPGTVGQVNVNLDLANNLFWSWYPFHDTPITQVTVSRYDNQFTRKSTRIGQRIFDERITLSWDPLDPDLGRVPFVEGQGAGAGKAYAVRPITWVKDGVLTALAYPAGVTSVPYGGDRLDVRGVPGWRSSFGMTGGTTTIPEMIATTERGLLVTRFASIMMLDNATMLCTGATRDGLWLIEHGALSHPVKNLRWTESPLVAFNQVDEIGAPVPVFSPELPAMAPPIKLHDFTFTAEEDAI